MTRTYPLLLTKAEMRVIYDIFNNIYFSDSSKIEIHCMVRDKKFVEKIIFHVINKLREKEL